MNVKRIKQIRINNTIFKIKWDAKNEGANFNYRKGLIIIGTEDKDRIFEFICHELFEIVAIEMNVRFCRPDCPQDYIFMYDHRQHDTMMSMFSSLVKQFL